MFVTVRKNPKFTLGMVNYPEGYAVTVEMFGQKYTHSRIFYPHELDAAKTLAHRIHDTNQIDLTFYHHGYPWEKNKC